MKTTVYLHNFRDAFQGSQYENNFSYEGLGKLYEYLEEYEEATGDEIDLDICSISQDYTEYENIESFHKDYDEEEYKTFDDIENNTEIIYFDDNKDENTSFIIKCF